LLGAQKFLIGIASHKLFHSLAVLLSHIFCWLWLIQVFLHQLGYETLICGSFVCIEHIAQAWLLLGFLFCFLSSLRERLALATVLCVAKSAGQQFLLRLVRWAGQDLFELLWLCRFLLAVLFLFVRRLIGFQNDLIALGTFHVQSATLGLVHAHLATGNLFLAISAHCHRFHFSNLLI